MTDYVLQGIACEFGKCFSHGDEIIYLKPGCVSYEPDIRLLLDHEGKSLGTTADRLQVHIGDEAIAFRFAIPESWSASFAEKADELETYLPISAGMNITKTETMTIDGEQVKVIVKATLNEISVLSGEPAIKSTYGRVVSLETCDDLEDEANSGRLQLVGRFVSLHRKMKATENGGEIRYTHVTSDYERKASAFERALAKLL
jgi:hypothetical protein